MTKDLDEMIASLTPLMQKALGCEGIYAHCVDYDDYFQMLSLALLGWLRRYPKRRAEDWEGHLFNRFRWEIRDLRRKNLRVVKLKDRLAAQPHSDSYTIDDALDTKAVLVKLDAHLNKAERRFLKQRLAGQTITDIARRSKVSRPTVYRWKKKVQEKYEDVTD